DGGQGGDGGADSDAGTSDAGTSDAGPFLPPLLIERPPESFEVTPRERVTLRAVAEDPQDSVMRFAWDADVGTLEEDAKDTATTSEIVWTAPPCLEPGDDASFTLTVSNALDLAVIARFSATGLPPCPTWTQVSAMSRGRAGATATLLASGKVLVAGGREGASGTASLATVELYDPETGLWAATGSLAAARTLHTATLLPSGKVLVAGGANGTTVLASAELYDPVAGTWTSAGNLTAARAYATATPLPSGKVLVAGGSDLDIKATLATAQLYDPATNTWTATGNMLGGRSVHAAVLLASGKVLVVGGLGNSGVLYPTELYDPATGTWTATGTLSSYRVAVEATLLHTGSVLVTSDNSAQAELYDPATGLWSRTARMVTGSQFHRATLLPSGQVLVTGGQAVNGDAPLARAEIYDPPTGTWAATTPLRRARIFHTATLLPSGKVLVTGGDNGTTPLSVAEVFSMP
ncbi:Kelch repeat-containing protein, partial [Corallococcus praedator]|uniref:Kelch repeat-containing protein n=2 Tax=Corallococcus TaxID=83461 RepID=UPI002447487C